MAYKKINKEFCLSDDSVNVYGYRLLTSGLMLERFKPAIGFLMHDRESGIAVRWEDIRTEGGKVFASPVVNTTKFPNLVQEIEDGFYAAASVGHIVAVELTDDPKYKLEGQTGPTVTKWFPRECSIVDIPGNYNAIAKLYDDKDNVLRDLSDNFSLKHKDNMDEKVFKVADLKLPGTTADLSIDQINAKIGDLAARADKADKLEKELADLKAEANKKEVYAILEKGMADKKLTKELADKLGKDYEDNPSGLKMLVDAMQPQTTITDKLGDAKVPAQYEGKTWQDLYCSGELEVIKTKYPEYYEQLKQNR